MIQQIERLQPLYNNEYVDGMSVISLPMPYVVESVYITTGNIVHVVNMDYLRIIDADINGIYEWYVYSDNDTYIPMYGVYHDTKNLPILLINKYSMGNFMKKHGCYFDKVASVTSKHLIDYYLSTMSNEVYSAMIDEHDFGRDITKFPKYMCKHNSSVPQIAIELKKSHDEYNNILTWFNDTHMYPYSPKNIKSLINKSVLTIVNTKYDFHLNELLEKISLLLHDTSIDCTNILINCFSDGYITHNKLKKMSNTNNSFLSRSNMAYDVTRYKNRYIRNLDTRISHYLIELLAICPVREFYFNIGKNGTITDLSVNDLYGYDSKLLIRYFNILTPKLARLYPFMNVEFFKTWDNQFIIIPNKGILGIEVHDITTSIMACSEFVHMF